MKHHFFPHRFIRGLNQHFRLCLKYLVGLQTPKYFEIRIQRLIEITTSPIMPQVKLCVKYCYIEKSLFYRLSLLLSVKTAKGTIVRLLRSLVVFDGIGFGIWLRLSDSVPLHTKSSFALQ